MEDIMAKGQKRSNREIRKPKKTKPAAAASAPARLNIGLPPAINMPKKKS
jgi:hypothetical protein